MRRFISTIGAYVAGAALGAAAPWIWYYGGKADPRDQLLYEFVGPPGLGATLFWVFLGLGIAFALREEGRQAACGAIRLAGRQTRSTL